MGADCVVSGADPKTTFLTMMDPAELPADFAAQIGHYRLTGTLAKLNLALSALPAFAGCEARHLSGRIHIGPSMDPSSERARPGVRRLVPEPVAGGLDPSLVDARWRRPAPTSPRSTSTARLAI